MRYILTERTYTNMNGQTTPTGTDPVAQAMRKHTGVYDLRDGRSEDVIVASSNNLRHMRNYQARLNTADTLRPVFYS